MIQAYQTHYLFLVFLGTFHASTLPADMGKKFKMYGTELTNSVLVASKVLLSDTGIRVGFHMVKRELTDPNVYRFTGEVANNLFVKEIVPDQLHTPSPLAILVGCGMFAAGIYGMRSAWNDLTKPVCAHHQSPEEEAAYQRISLRSLVYPVIGMGACAFMHSYLVGWNTPAATLDLSRAIGALVFIDYTRKKEFLNRKLCHALQTDNTQEAVTCLEHGADMNFHCKCDSYESDRLPIQGKIWDKPEILAIALKKGLNPNARFFNSGVTLLHLTHNPTAAQILLDHGADINALSMDPTKTHPLVNSLYFGNDRIVDLFFNQPTLKLNKQTPWLNILINSKRPLDNTKSLKRRIYDTNLLLDKGADITGHLPAEPLPLETLLLKQISIQASYTPINKSIDELDTPKKRLCYALHCDAFLLIHTATKQKRSLFELIGSHEAIDRVNILCDKWPGIKITKDFFDRCLNNDADALDLLQRTVNKIHYDIAELRYADFKNSLKKKNQSMNNWLLNREMTGSNRVPNQLFPQE